MRIDYPGPKSAKVKSFYELPDFQGVWILPLHFSVTNQTLIEKGGRETNNQETYFHFMSQKRDMPSFILWLIIFIQMGAETAEETFLILGSTLIVSTVYTQK